LGGSEAFQSFREALFIFEAHILMKLSHLRGGVSEFLSTVRRAQLMSQQYDVTWSE